MRRGRSVSSTRLTSDLERARPAAFFWRRGWPSAMSALGLFARDVARHWSSTNPIVAGLGHAGPGRSSATSRRASRRISRRRREKTRSGDLGRVDAVDDSRACRPTGCRMSTSAARACKTLASSSTEMSAVAAQSRAGAQGDEREGGHGGRGGRGVERQHRLGGGQHGAGHHQPGLGGERDRGDERDDRRDRRQLREGAGHQRARPARRPQSVAGADAAARRRRRRRSAR